MSNYPPGTSAGDPNAPWNAPDRSHDHEWRPVDGLNPIIEDGAAIFHEDCCYAEGRYGEGWECEESRSYRFEYSHLEVAGGGKIMLPTIHEWDEMDESVKAVVVVIEEAERDDNSLVDVRIDPDPECGEVAIDFLEYTLYYKP